MASRPLSPAKRRAVVKLYGEGLAAAAIVRRIGTSSDRIPEVIDLIREETGGYSSLKTKATDNRDRIIKLAEAGLNYSEIGAELKISRDVVSRVARAAGVASAGRDYRGDNVPEQEVLTLHALGELSYEEIGRRFDVSRSVVRRIIDKHRPPKRDGVVGYRRAERLPLPRKGEVRRYVFTCAQNNTKLNEDVWKSLLALAKEYDAKVFVASFNYNRAAYGAAAVKRGTADAERGVWFDPRVESYFAESDKRLQITPSLVWCGEVNLSPTTKRPLSGFEDYTRTASSVFPHPRLAMQSVPATDSGAKLIYTTGVVTQRNYIQKAVGMKAEFHHSYGGLLVEVNGDGSFFARQLVASDSGEIQDLNVRVKGGRVVSRKARVRAINWGDAHVARLEDAQRELCWGKGGILDSLRPERQFFHDTLDFYARSHHDADGSHRRYKIFLEGKDSVEDEITQAAEFLRGTSRPWCESVVVSSNHDAALDRWLETANYKTDHVNRRFFLECELARAVAAESKDDGFNVVEWAVRRAADVPRVRFLRMDESFVDCGIEFGIHGHAGPNGARGSPAAFAKMGRRANIGHFHSAQILDGVFVAGVSGPLRMGYNRGPSSWSHSHIITYPSGARAILTTWRGAWRARP